MADRDEYATVVIEREGGVGSFLLGVLLGAGAALLFAPRAGEQTRSEIRAGMTRLRDRASEGVRDLQDTVSGRYQEVRTEMSGRMTAARDAIDTGRRTTTERVRETGAAIRAGYDAARHPRDDEPGGVGESGL